ncbi:MAG: hypothetical protein KIS78_05730 [Labilithrix sp.]|nr:hypothetical protein [Labilithrix sp.]
MSTPLLGRLLVTISATFALVALSACSDDDDKPTTTSSSSGGSAEDGGSSSGASGGSCAALCTAAGYSGGTEMDFENGVVECPCTGSGSGITKAACEGYCAEHGVGADKSFLSSENGTNDKCVCDGISP